MGSGDGSGSMGSGDGSGSMGSGDAAGSGSMGSGDGSGSMGSGDGSGSMGSGDGSGSGSMGSGSMGSGSMGSGSMVTGMMGSGSMSGGGSDGDGGAEGGSEDGGPSGDSMMVMMMMSMSGSGEMAAGSGEPGAPLQGEEKAKLQELLAFLAFGISSELTKAMADFGSGDTPIEAELTPGMMGSPPKISPIDPRGSIIMGFDMDYPQGAEKVPYAMWLMVNVKSESDLGNSQLVVLPWKFDEESMLPKGSGGARFMALVVSQEGGEFDVDDIKTKATEDKREGFTGKELSGLLYFDDVSHLYRGAKPGVVIYATYWNVCPEGETGCQPGKDGAGMTDLTMEIDMGEGNTGDDMVMVSVTNVIHGTTMEIMDIPLATDAPTLNMGFTMSDDDDDDDDDEEESTTAKKKCMIKNCCSPKPCSEKPNLTGGGGGEMTTDTGGPEICAQEFLVHGTPWGRDEGTPAGGASHPPWRPPSQPASQSVSEASVAKVRISSSKQRCPGCSQMFGNPGEHELLVGDLDYELVRPPGASAGVSRTGPPESRQKKKGEGVNSRMYERYVTGRQTEALAPGAGLPTERRKKKKKKKKEGEGGAAASSTAAHLMVLSQDF
ncbi:unnamed protein product [Notodromas monacha]|uniref:Uncharacterized protein n=1 Tax=Notodromas monacha TaxID=399045 RepID=A0A7R9G9N3_9CRUS|nr:unnamed protein product [Notodromas monacha]CAG0914393.1 unnamed protein product [Notodromas monacha]